MERIDSGKIVTREDGDKTVFISLRVRGAASARSGLRAEGKPTLLGGEEVRLGNSARAHGSSLKLRLGGVPLRSNTNP